MMLRLSAPARPALRRQSSCEAAAEVRGAPLCRTASALAAPLPPPGCSRTAGSHTHKAGRGSRLRVQPALRSVAASLPLPHAHTPLSRTRAPTARSGSRRRCCVSAAAGGGLLLADGGVVSGALGALAALRALEHALLLKTLAVVRFVAHVVHTLVHDPWGPEEVLFIVVWMAAVRPLLHGAHRAWCAAHASTTGAAAAPSLSDFDDSLAGRAVTPLRQLGWAFLALWAFDNGLALAALSGLHVERAASPLLSGTPALIYTVWAGYAALHFQNAWFAARCNERGERAGAGASRTTLQHALGLATVATTVALVGRIVGADLRTLLGLGGLLGFASSLAVKDVLTNLFSGIQIALHRPFVEGDEITFGATNVFRCTARVVKLGYFQTVLRDAESQLIYVPNASLTNQTISNAGRRTHTRLSGDLTLRYEDVPRLEATLAAVAAALRALPQLDERAAPVGVFVSGYKPAGVVVKVEAMFARDGPVKKDALRSRAWLAVARAVEAQGCAFATPLQG
jgi:small-conductance mechanosensitive channel